MGNHYEKIKDLISINEIESALDRLDNLVNTNQSSQLTLLKSRYHLLKNNQISGILSHSDYTLELNKIKFSLLQLAAKLGTSENSSIRNSGSLSISKINEDEEVFLKFKKTITGETFKIGVNPNTEIGELARQILIAFEPDYESNFLFIENRIIVTVLKVLSSGELVSLDNHKNVKECNLKNNDIIMIQFDLREERRFYKLSR